MPRNRDEIAADLKRLADDLWRAEFRIDVDEDAALLLEAAAALAAPTDADMRAFGASDAACYKWPDDTPEHRALRAAYIEGAADAPGPARKLCDGCDGHDCDDFCAYPMTDPFQHQRS